MSPSEHHFSSHRHASPSEVSTCCPDFFDHQKTYIPSDFYLFSQTALSSQAPDFSPVLQDLISETGVKCSIYKSVYIHISPGDPGDRCPFYCHSSGQRQHIFSIDHNLFPPALCLSLQISAYLDSFLFVSNIFRLSTSEIPLSYPLCQSSKH